MSRKVQLVGVSSVGYKHTSAITTTADVSIPRHSRSTQCWILTVYSMRSIEIMWHNPRMLIKHVSREYKTTKKRFLMLIIEGSDDLFVLSTPI